MAIRHLVALVTLGLLLGFSALGDAQPTGAHTDTDRAPFLNSYVGQYHVTDSFSLEITRVGDALYAKASGQPAAQLRPRSETEFVIVGSSLRLIFGVDPVTGVVDHLVFEQGGFGRRAEKLVGTPEPLTRAALVLGPDTLTRYVGTYQEQPGFALTVSLDHGRLVAGFVGQDAELIVPESESDFFFAESATRLSFDLEPDGPATGLTLHQGGSDISLHRLEN